MKISNEQTSYLAATALILICIADIVTPTYFVPDFLYVGCIFIVIKQPRRVIVRFSIAALLLILFNALVVDQLLKQRESMFVNRGVSLVFVTIIITYIVLYYSKMRQQSRLKQQQYLKTLEEMLFITSHKVRRPVANILGLIETIHADQVELSTDDLKERCDYLQISAVELDSFIKELTSFIEFSGQTQHQL